MDEQLRTEFNEWARAGKGESMEKGHRPVGEQAIARMQISPDARVLDVGCGSGWATRMLAEYAFNGRVTGIDISDEMIRVARESSRSLPNVDFEIASAEQLPFPDHEFTHAFSMESLYYYRNIPKALKEIHRVLKPGGLFVAIMDLYWENEATHQWIDTLKVPVELLRVGELLADAGLTICTGGYSGVMEAASRGAHERGGRVIGITMNQFKSEPNRYLTEKVPSEHFYERLQRLITRSVGYIALRGGMGTVTEISLVWNKLQTGVLDPRPLVLLGDCWPPIVRDWQRHLAVSDDDVRILNFANTPEEAVAIINEKSKGVIV